MYFGRPEACKIQLISSTPSYGAGPAPRGPAVGPAYGGPGMYGAGGGAGPGCAMCDVQYGPFGESVGYQVFWKFPKVVNLFSTAKVFGNVFWIDMDIY